MPEKIVKLERGIEQLRTPELRRGDLRVVPPLGAETHSPLRSTDGLAKPASNWMARLKESEHVQALSGLVRTYAAKAGRLFSTSAAGGEATPKNRFLADLELADRYRGPPGFLQEIREWALDTPNKALARIEEKSPDLPKLNATHLAQILSALDVKHAWGEHVASDRLLTATTHVLTAHLDEKDRGEVHRWLAQNAAAQSASELGPPPEISPRGQGLIRGITTRMRHDGHVLASRLSEVDAARYEVLQARRLTPGDMKGAQDYIWALTHTRSAPGTRAELLDDPGLEPILDPEVTDRRAELAQRLKAYDPMRLDDPEVQNIAEQLRGLPLDKNGRPPRVGVRDEKTGVVYPLVDKNGPGARVLPLPEGLLAQKTNAAYPRMLADVLATLEQAKAATAKAASEGRVLTDAERPKLWLHDFAFQSDGTGWAMAAYLVAARAAGVDVRLQYDPVGSANSNISIDSKGKVKQLTTDAAIRQYLIDNGVRVLPFPTGKGSIVDAEAKDYLSHLKKDLVGLAAYVGGGGNKGDQYSIKSIFHDAMTRITGHGTGDTAQGLAAFWNYSAAETLRREQRDHPDLAGAAFDDHIRRTYGGPLDAITQEHLAAYRRTLENAPGAEMDPYRSVTQVDHWGGHQDENGKEALMALAEVSQRRFAISMPYPTDPFFALTAIRAERNLKKYQDEHHVPLNQREHAVVVVPAFNDVSYEYWGMLKKYKAMIEAGVEVYQFRGDPMLHNKFLVADDFWEHGSHNGDWRSRFGNNENIAFQWLKPEADKYAARVDDLKANGVRVTLEMVNAQLAKFPDRFHAEEADALDRLVKL